MPRPVRPADGALGQQPGRREFPQPAAHRLGVQPGDITEQALGQRRARHRQGRQHRLGVPGAAARPRRQQPASRAGSPAGTCAITICGAGQRRGYQLLGEERIPLARAYNSSTTEAAPARPPAQRPARPPLPATGAQPDLLHPRRSRACASQSVTCVQRRLITAARRHHPHRIPDRGPGQEGQAIQRCAVRPVHILDHHPDPRRSTPSHRIQQVRHGGKQPLPLPPLTPPPDARAIIPPQPRQQPPNLLPHIRRSRRQTLLQQPPALQPAQLAQRLHHRQQRQRARQRQAFPPHHRHPPSRSPGHALPGEPGLAHPRIPDHKHHPGIPAQRPHQARQLTLTANKDPRPCHPQAQQPAPARSIPTRLDRPPNTSVAQNALDAIEAPGGRVALAEQSPGRDGAEHDRTAFLYRHADRVCGYLCLASRLITGYRSPSTGYRPATDAERVIRPCIMVVWVAVQLRRHGIARRLVDAAARHAGVTLSGLGWAEPFTDSGYLLAQSISPDGLRIADYS